MRSRCFLALVGLAFGLAQASQAQTSLRFFGSGANFRDQDRVKIRIDGPPVPADVGATDFTIELWLKGTRAQNAGTVTQCGNTYDGWIRGNIFFDRDRHSSAPGFGISLGAGRIAFAVVNASRQTHTVCGSIDVLDGAWHHLAMQRSSSGNMRIYVDGALDAEANGPSGNISYPDGGLSENRCGPTGDQPCTNSDPFIVLGAEKHDAGTEYPAFNGFMDELRISTVLRYPAPFTRPAAPFVLDSDTAALYHFDDGSGLTLTDADGGQSPGELKIGGPQNGPQWSTDVPPFTPTAGNIQMQSGTASVTEMVGGSTLTLNVVRTGTMGPATVDYATGGGTATPGSDYTTRSGTLNWANGVGGNQSVQIPILDDSTFESAETFNFTLTNATGATLVNPMATVVTINDNDSGPTPGALQFSAAAYSAQESAGTTNLSVARTGGSTGAVAVSYAVTGGTASSGTDFTLAAGILNWANGDTAAKAIPITIVSDTSVEPNETVNVELSGPTNGATIGVIGSTVLTVNDDDGSTPPPPPPPPPDGSSSGGGALGYPLLLLSVLLAWRRRTVMRSACTASR